jgi:hypothetical protein
MWKLGLRPKGLNNEKLFETLKISNFFIWFHLYAPFYTLKLTSQYQLSTK